jgi:hypothetical protein
MYGSDSNATLYIFIAVTCYAVSLAIFYAIVKAAINNSKVAKQRESDSDYLSLNRNISFTRILDFLSKTSIATFKEIMLFTKIENEKLTEQLSLLDTLEFVKPLEDNYIITEKGLLWLNNINRDYPSLRVIVKNSITVLNHISINFKDKSFVEADIAPAFTFNISTSLDLLTKRGILKMETHSYGYASGNEAKKYSLDSKSTILSHLTD